MTLFIRLLGAPEISHADKPLQFKGRKALALLAYLLVTGQAHSRQHLVDLLYEEADDPRAGLRWDLNHLRQVIGPLYIEADREQVRFNFEGDYWLDVTAFTAGQTELYRGDFLAALEVRGAQPFTEWLYFQRERLRAAYEQALLRRCEQSRQQGEYERLVELAQQLIQLDNLREEWHRTLMQGYALLGKWEAALAQYDLCREVLLRELQHAPGPETEALYRQIQARSLADPRPLAELTPRWPAFLSAGTVEALPAPLFVARERQLAQLDAWLRQALAGRGQTVFVSGGPGQGKSSLLAEFARRAQAAQPRLLVALGGGTAFAGQGDPYLPFKEILAMLTGEVETHLAAGAVSQEQARRLWANLLPATQALLEHGPHLLDTLIPQRDLLARLALAAPERVDEVSHRLAQSREAAASPLAQEHLFQQVTQLLRALARHAPLLLLLDDLHWADASSLSLLFHLGRRLGDSPILLLGAYRPDEVSQKQGFETHPLAKILMEFKRSLGQVWLELDRLDETENRHFVEALLDAEPNELGAEFRRTLYRSTAGQPLFTVELLRMMQERGDLRQNEQGHWVEGDSLAWELLPARVEAVIAERLNRLEPELRQALGVASVSGEEFVAQAVARVQNLDERQWLGQLAQVVERQHHLVRERGEAQVGDETLSRYQFAHALFQRYLYQNLGRAERRLLHGEVGAALEKLYGDHSGQVAGQLAWHFQEAQRPAQARPYLRQAGEQAARQYANEEALAYFNRALELTPAEARTERLALLLAREQIYNLQGKRQAQQQDLTALQELVALLGDGRQRTEVTLRQARYAEAISDYPAAIAAAQAAVSLAQAHGDTFHEATGYEIWSEALCRQGSYEAAQSQLEKALALAQAGHLRSIEAEVWVNLGDAAFGLENYAQSGLYIQQALTIYRELGDRQGEAVALNDLGLSFTQQAVYDVASLYFQQALAIQQQIGDTRRMGDTLNNLGEAYLYAGDYAQAELYSQQALQVAYEVNDREGLGLTRTNLGLLAHYRGDESMAQHYGQEALLIAQELGDRDCQGYALTTLGHALTGLGHLAEAAEVYRQALDLRRELEQPNLAMESVAGLARVALAQADLPQALAYTEEILGHLETNTLEGAEHPFRIYLTCYEVLLAAEDSRATSFLAQVYRLLQEQAAKISDESLRRSFLEQVAAHRELVEAFEENETGRRNLI